ncbi:hypothetical protein M9H77_12547 [Catharanthus roseus]|uniref:Uncharacterized protein n=1 Tax=Catharanthus roseus TaxID=4058 RepID=A0ACC0BHV5_CATRO|nr:hypothetical protein M9H77_12547 [Catharanthus roseus]
MPFLLPCRPFMPGSVRLVQTRARLSFPRAASESEEVASSNLRSKDMVPSSDPPSSADVNVLYQFFEKRFFPPSDWKSYLDYAEFNFQITHHYSISTHLFHKTTSQWSMNQSHHQSYWVRAREEWGPAMISGFGELTKREIKDGILVAKV